jgi:Fe-S-cluster containining protein
MPEAPRATLHLRVLGQSRKISVTVPGTPAAIEDLLPAAQEITDQTMAAACEHTAAAGHPPTCREGCTACCHQLVAISVAEALNLARIVDALEPERRQIVSDRFTHLQQTLRAARLLDPASPDDAPVMLLQPESKTAQDPLIHLAHRYYALHLPCPFLENDRCSVYDQRPLVCREYMVTSPVLHCDELGRHPLAMIESPVHLSDGLADLVAEITHEPARQIPLFSALAFAKSHEKNRPLVEQSTLTGPQLLIRLAKWIDSQSNIPLADRPPS